MYPFSHSAPLRQILLVPCDCQVHLLTFHWKGKSTDFLFSVEWITILQTSAFLQKGSHFYLLGLLWETLFHGIAKMKLPFVFFFMIKKKIHG